MTHENIRNSFVGIHRRGFGLYGFLTTSEYMLTQSDADETYVHDLQNLIPFFQVTKHLYLKHSENMQICL